MGLEDDRNWRGYSIRVGVVEVVIAVTMYRFFICIKGRITLRLKNNDLK
jgi:hypothetical protein